MRNLLYENVFYMQLHFYANLNHFHNNGFALRLALKQRHNGPRKWPIAFHVRAAGVGCTKGGKNDTCLRRNSLKTRQGNLKN